MTFEIGVVPEEWRSAMIISLYKGKEEGTHCKNCRSISVLYVFGKLHRWVLVGIVRGVTEGLIDN